MTTYLLYMQCSSCFVPSIQYDVHTVTRTYQLHACMGRMAGGIYIYMVAWAYQLPIAATVYIHAHKLMHTYVALNDAFFTWISELTQASSLPHPPHGAHARLHVCIMMYARYLAIKPAASSTLKCTYVRTLVCMVWLVQSRQMCVHAKQCMDSTFAMHTYKRMCTHGISIVDCLHGRIKTLTQTKQCKANPDYN